MRDLNKKDSKALVIFAKEPVLNKVKTRLQGTLSTRGCLQLYKAFLKDTLSLSREIACQTIITFDHNNLNPKYLKAIARKQMLIKQCDGNLGQRLRKVIYQLKKRSYLNLVIIGSDSPDLPSQYLKRAFDGLAHSDIVIGPTWDGGFYLIGMKCWHPKLFSNVTWSSHQTCAQVVKNIRTLKLSWFILPRWSDVDDAKSFKLLKGRLFRNKLSTPFTRKALMTLK